MKDETLFFEVMKSITWGILFCIVSFVRPPAYGGQEASGVYGVEVVVKEKPGKRTATDVNGNFVLTALPAGSYTLSFRARPAKEMPSSTGDKVIVATMYSIKIEGTKGTLKRNGLTSDKLLAGVEVPVAAGLGGNVRGEVRPVSSKKMVWVPNRTGSLVPGHWAEEGSDETSPHHIYELGPGNWAYR